MCPVFIPKKCWLSELLHYGVMVMFCMLKQVLRSWLCDKRNNVYTEQMLLLLAQNRRHCQWGAWRGNDWRMLFLLLCSSWHYMESKPHICTRQMNNQKYENASFGPSGSRNEKGQLHGTRVQVTTQQWKYIQELKF